MSRITGKDAANLIEAYNSLYAPQEEVELTEEQVQEDFENWVNSLVEEGYDLSEYTWEDMYEAYIGEDIKSFADRGGLLGAAQRAFARSGTEQGKAQNRAAVGRFFGGINQAAINRIRQNVPQTTAAKPKPTPSAQQSGMYGRYNEPTQFITRPAPTTPAARPSTAPAAPTTRPSAQPVGSARPTPAPQKPTATATPPGPPSRYNPLMQRTFGYQTGNAPDQIAKASQGTSQATSDAAFKKSREMVNKMRSTPTLSQSFDIFDIVKGYLIDEGYAETEEAAAVIMANMSDEWREEILDERNRGERDMSPEAVRDRRDGRDGDTTSGGYKPYVKAGGRQEADHKRSRGVKKQKGKVLPHMRGPNDNVSNYHAVRGED